MRKLLLFAFAVFAFAACTQNDVEELSSNRADVPETLTIGFEGGDDTRIQLNEAQKTVWTKGDQVSVFYKSYDNLKFEFEGNTGDRNGTLKRVGGQHNGQTMDDVVVVYPYSADYMITLSEGCVNATIPSTQTYLKGSYGVGDNLMIARSSFNQFSLKSVCGWLKIQLTGDGEVIERITFRGNNGEQVAGLVYVDATTAEATLATAKHNSDDNSQLDGTLVLDDSIYTEVTLDCGEGVALGAEATAFYIAIPPQTFEQGFTVEIEDIDALKMTKSTDKAVIIERNTIQPMTSFEVDVKPVLSDYYITTEFDIDTPGKELYYVNELSKMVNEGNTLVNIDYGDGSFGKTVPHTYEAAGRYTVKFYFESPITEIADYAFHYSHVRSVVIPASVTQLGYMSFNSSSLEGVQLIFNKLLDYLKGKGLAMIEAKGADFNTDFHEAVAQFPVQDEAMKGKVFDVALTGYTLGGEILRHAKVVVGI